MASDVGTIGLSEEEVNSLRLYLKKGGFLWVDDFWGEAAWDQWSHELGQALPPTEYSIEDVPLSDPIFRSMMVVKKFRKSPALASGVPWVEGPPRSAARSLPCRTSARYATAMDASSR